MSSYTVSHTATFTITHAKYLASKVAADLKRMQRFYGSPSDSWISDYEAELTQLLKGGYLEKVTYGFKRDGNFIEPTLIYTARDLFGLGADDDDPGRVRPGADVSGATFHSYLSYTSAWSALSDTQKAGVGLPFKRTGAAQPGISGYETSDKTYSAGGMALGRTTVRSY